MGITVTVHLDTLSEDQKRDLNQAIGYLSTWAYNHYDVVDIYPDYLFSTDSHSLIACFRKTNDKNTEFVIGAIWDKETLTYSYHS